MKYRKDKRTKKSIALEVAVLTLLMVPVWGGPDFAEAAEAQQKSRDITVTAAKTEVEIKAEPQAVEVITAEDIKRLGADNVTAALRLAANLDLSKAGMTGNAVMLRGMSTTHSLILVNGKRIAGEDTDVTQNVYTLNRINVDSIERIEIVRGASSALYGSDAMGGVINIITKVPEKEQTTAGFTTGSDEINNYYRFDFGKDGRWSTSFDARFTKVRADNHYAYDVSSSGAVTDGYNRTMYGPKQYFNFDAVYDFENANQNKLRFGANYLKEHLRSDYANTTATVFTDSGLVTAAPSASLLVNDNKREFYDNEGYGFDLAYSGETKQNKYEFRVYYNQLEKDSHLYNDRVLPNEQVTITFPPMMHQDPLHFDYSAMYPKTDYDHAKYYTWVMEGKDTAYLGDRHTLTFGGEFRKVDYQGTRLAAPLDDGTKQSADRDVDSYAGYVEDLWQANDKLLVVPSVRAEHNSQFGSNATPKLGITYSFDEHTRFKANYGRGYKAPSISELYMRMHRAMGVTTVDVYGNPDLQPEKSLSYDFSLEAERSANFGKLTYYNNKVTNLISAEAINDDGTQNRYVNIGAAQINGIEAELGRHLNDRLTVKMTNAYIDATNKGTGERLNNRAKNTTTLQLLYDDHQEKGISAVLWDEFSDSYRYNDQEYSYNTVNFSLQKKWSKDLSTFFGVDNILNKKVDDLYIDGRVWRVGAEVKF